MSDSTQPLKRRIRSFVKREGRLTQGQQRALEECFPIYGVTLEQGLLDFDVVFKRKANRILEIGFGNGASLLEMAQHNPQNDYLGVEVHRPGVGNLLSQVEEKEISNIRVSINDAIEVLNQQIPEQSLDLVHLFFPDPWHKRNHHKRRIVQDEFAQIIRSKLKVDGKLHMATDWKDYAKHMMQVLTRAEGFINMAGEGEYMERPEHRPLTKFEQRGKNLGHDVWDLMFRKKN
jgi:tRNA (guanine-N7-)-methyltransferase